LEILHRRQRIKKVFDWRKLVRLVLEKITYRLELDTELRLSLDHPG
jgi:hypothetical protein